MPTRTLVRELCDVCYADDETETEATDRLRFAFQGHDYLLLVCEEHVGPIRDDLQHLSEIATPELGRRRAAPAASRAARTARPASDTNPVVGAKTAFSRLDDGEKARFRVWADLPNARRIADSRVEDWVRAGRP